ncbi:MAG TPA: CsbD family protein [Longimicrobiales bacterium]|nr:CsbD family protein [Longimicrobiales bacterium]
MADRKDLHREGTENRVEGAAEELEGKIRGGVGDALDDRDEHIKGRAKEMKGKIKKKFGEAQQDVADRDRNRNP